jgi:DNA-binding CsgD family transcriptional regulator
MTNIQIPAGLIDQNIELFKANDSVLGIHNGVVKHLFEMPFAFLDILKAEMNANHSIVKSLKMAGFKNERSRLEKFAECRFGGFDLNADYKDGVLAESEYHECGFRGNCDMEGIVCNFFKVKGQIISPFEIQMIKHLASDDKLTLIAQKMKVSINTFEIKKQRLFEKLEVMSRPRLVAYAFELQILNAKPCTE